MNGSGKTTFIKLLCHLYDPTEGKILLNGIDIRKYDYEEYMKIFSVVFQDFKLFSFSLGQNVAVDMDYDTKRVEACLDAAGFVNRRTSMPDGLKTCLYKDFEENGVEISGGEAQKIALARALYKDAPFIVLDEPFLWHESCPAFHKPYANPYKYPTWCLPWNGDSCSHPSG